jgi:8-oxo-dGTP diphosphatase|tara:strand:+ start:22880 stop:23569 length:690 start_codon:yes stop_codon:yes gene_type:complete
LKPIKYSTEDRIHVAVDCIIFGFDGQELKALLIHRKMDPGLGVWSLMGGFVKIDESLDEAAVRILHSLTGLDNIYMEQLHSYGAVHRDIGGRVISVAYFALINIEDYEEQVLDEHDARWVPLNELPDLIFDHKQMVQDAHQRLRQKVANHPIGFALLPEKFTLPQLLSLYEAIYDAPIDKRNFSRKMLSLGILKKLAEKEKSSSRKGAFFYVFDQEKYEKLSNEGLSFI